MRQAERKTRLAENTREEDDGMKFEQGQPVFQPIVITLETAAEVTELFTDLHKVKYPKAHGSEHLSETGRALYTLLYRSRIS